MFTLFFTLILVFLFALAIGAFFMQIVSQSINRRGDLGINFRHPICPNCGEKTDLIRPPTMKQPVAWGSGVCSICGCEMDKWGNEISTLPENQKIAKQLEHLKITPLAPFDEFGKTRLEKIFEENDK